MIVRRWLRSLAAYLGTGTVRCYLAGHALALLTVTQHGIVWACPDCHRWHPAGQVWRRDRRHRAREVA